MKFARWTFLIAGIYGLIALMPQYAMFNQVGIDYPPAITHPEYFYGFIGVGVAWQIVFLVIASDPARYRPMMLVGVIEKISFTIPVFILYLNQRTPAIVFAFSLIDLLLASLFLNAYSRTKKVSSRIDTNPHE